MSDTKSSLWRLAFNIALLLALFATPAALSYAQSCQSAVGVSNSSGIVAAIQNFNNFCTDGQTMHIDVVGTINLGNQQLVINNSTTATLTISGLAGNGLITGSRLGMFFDILRGNVRFESLHFDRKNSLGGSIENTGGNIAVLRSLFTRNENHLGGAIQNRANGHLVIESSTFSENNAHQGGAIFNNGILEISNSTFYFNRAQKGGAIYHNLGMDGTFTMINSTISSNIAPDGSAIFNFLGTMEIVASTIVNNAGGKAVESRTGLSSSSGTFVFKNSIVANNPDGNCTFKVLAFGINFTTDGSCVVNGGGTRFKRVTTEELNLSALDYHGGATPTHIPRRPSVAIDAVNDCRDLHFILVEADQREFTRPPLQGCDAGSVELGAPTPLGAVIPGDADGNNEINFIDGRECVGLGGPESDNPRRPGPLDPIVPNPPLFPGPHFPSPFPGCDTNNNGFVDEEDLNMIGNQLIGNNPPIGWPINRVSAASDQQSTPFGLGVLLALTALGIIMRWRWKRINHLALLLAIGLVLSSCGLFPAGTPALYAILSDQFITISVQNMPGGGLASMIATNGGFVYDPLAVQIKSIQPVGDFGILTTQSSTTLAKRAGRSPIQQAVL